MTACVEGTQKEKKEGGALSNKVIRAVLAAVLAIGLMPALAFAEEPTSTEDQGIMPLATDDEAFLANDVTYNQTPDAEGNYIFDYTKAAVDFTVKGVTDINGVALVAGTDYDVAYFTAKDGTKTTVAGSGAAAEGAAPVKPGTYYLGAYKHGATPTATNVIYQAFVIKSVSLDKAVVYQVNGKDLSDVSDTTFTYTGTEIELVAAAPAVGDTGKLWIAIDGKPMTFTTDVALSTSAADITAAGTYTLKAVGDGDYAGQTRYIDITVEKFDLSKATVVIPDVATAGYADADAVLAATKVTLGSDELLAADVADLALKTTGFVGTVSGIPDNFTTKGKYTVSLTPATDALKANIANAGTGTFMVANALVQQIDYDTTALVANGTRNGNGIETSPIAIGAGETFAINKIKVAETQGGTALEINKGYTVAVTKDGTEVTSYSAPGVYKVVVTAKPGSDYALSGTCTFFFQVSKGAIAANGVFVSVNNTNVAGVNTATPVANYTGKAQTVNVVVKDADGNKLVAGTDFAVAITDADGNAVTDVVNAGIYTLKVTSDSYNIPVADGTGTFKFAVAGVKYTGIRVAGVVTITKSNPVSVVTGLPYTGTEIVPVYQYTTDDLTKLAGGIADKKVTWTTLPAEAYTATYTGALTDKKIVDAGTYTVALAKNTDKANAVVAANFDVTGAPQVWGGVVSTIDNTFGVINAQIFADVPVTSWFAQPISAAQAQEYMTGYFGTKLFGPNDMITRADAVCVIFNMAGGEVSNEGSSNEYISFASKFTDVDTKAYYAQALGWAAKSGIVNGYSDNTFAPNAQITREAFAAILANFAKAKGDDMKVDTAAVLAKFSDGDQVSDWAKNVVAWTADKKIMGNGGTLSPAATITRAEVAAMAVNYQPTKLG